MSSNDNGSRPARLRVVVTGLGAVTPLGIGAEQLHQRWAAGEVGIVDGAGACTDFEPKELPVGQADPAP